MAETLSDPICMGGSWPVLGPLQLWQCGPQVQQTLLQGKKLGDSVWLNDVTVGMLVHIQDQLMDRRYLLETGALFSQIPHKSSKTTATEPMLISPNTHPIWCCGEERRRLCFSGGTFEWPFLHLDISFPILGVDFLRANKLSVSVA